MAGMLHANPGKNYVGHKSVFEFVNDDGANRGTACGQCAIATVLANYRFLPKTIGGLRDVEKKYPADIINGVLGTSATRVQSALEGYGAGFRFADGRKGLEAAMRAKKAAICLIQNSSGLQVWDGAHWFVIFGCDDGGVHATNYLRYDAKQRVLVKQVLIPWADFEELWSRPIPVACGMGERVMVC